MQEVAKNYCVYRNEVHYTADERTQVLQDVTADPTLPRTKEINCPKCNYKEAVFYQVLVLQLAHNSVEHDFVGKGVSEDVG